jgi:glucosylceramidase
MGNTRRDFLALLFSGIGLALSPELLLSRGALAAGSGGGSVKVTVTGGEKRLAAVDPLTWHAPRADLAETITVDSGKKYQSMLGFGGAFTDASCYTFDKMPAEKRHKLIECMPHMYRCQRL